jgi:hypothetical protein
MKEGGKQLPEPNVDFYELAETLPPDEFATLRQVREFRSSNAST